MTVCPTKESLMVTGGTRILHCTVILLYRICVCMTKRSSKTAAVGFYWVARKSTWQDLCCHLDALRMLKSNCLRQYSNSLSPCLIQSGPCCSLKMRNHNYLPIKSQLNKNVLDFEKNFSELSRKKWTWKRKNRVKYSDS